MSNQRLKNLQKKLGENHIDALIVSSAVNIAYLTGYSNFQRHEREAYLLVTESGAILFTDGRYIEAIRNILPKDITVLLHTELFKKTKESKSKRIGVEDNFTLAELNRFKKALRSKIPLRGKTNKNFVLVGQLVENLRATKDENEIKNIRAACHLTDEAFKIIRPLIKLGITEKEIAWKMEKFIKESGAELAFETIVAFGKNSAIPHHQTSNKRLAKGDELVLLDFGAKVNGYCADFTRTLLTKSASEKARKVYVTVLEAQQAAIDYIKSDNKPNAISAAKIANKFIASKGFDEIPHGLGHGIGLEVHEGPNLSPISKSVLSQNNVFTIEPGIYIPGFGGVRIEDDFLLSDKLEQLTKSPKDIFEI